MDPQRLSDFMAGAATVAVLLTALNLVTEWLTGGGC